MQCKSTIFKSSTWYIYDPYEEKKNNSMETVNELNVNNSAYIKGRINFSHNPINEQKNL